MRVALISDIHGNEVALRAVLRSIERHGVDQIVCLGDVATLGVSPGEVVDTLKDLGCRCIMGNHDEYLFDEDLTHAYTSSSMILEAIDWCRHELPPEQIDFAKHFEKGFELPLGKDHQLKLFHGSPSSNIVDLLSETPGDVFDAQLGPERATVMAGGHTHLQMVRQHQGVLVVNPGSVGAPFKEFPNGGAPKIMSHAEYATIDGDGDEVSVTLHRVDLDRHELARIALDSSNPMSRELAAPYL